MLIVGYEQVSTIDFPGIPAMVIYTGNCTIRCPYCYNYLLLEDKGIGYTMEETMEKIRKVKPFVEGVVITGGEPTMYPDLPFLVSAIKMMGLKVKLDTNGTNPEMVKRLLPQLDYIAMDVKSDMVGYLDLGLSLDKFQTILETIKIIKKSNVPYEFRTTMVYPFVNENNYKSIGVMIMGAKKHVLQRAKMVNILDPEYPQHEIKDINWYKERFKYYSSEVIVRE